MASIKGSGIGSIWAFRHNPRVNVDNEQVLCTEKGCGYQQNAKEKKEAPRRKSYALPDLASELVRNDHVSPKKKVQRSTFTIREVTPQFKTCVRISSESFPFVRASWTMPGLYKYGQFAVAA